MLIAVKRLLIVLIGIILQFGFAIVLRLFFNNYIALVSIIYWLISILIVLNILRNSTKLSNDLPWVIIILIFPILGTIILITLNKNFKKNKLVKEIITKEKEYEKFYIQDEKVKKEIEDSNLDQLNFLMNYGKFPISKNNKITYYELGDTFYPELLKELKKAEKFIFMEYFIISKGAMWTGIFDILKEKASLGVEVRVMYDDMGSIATLPPKYSEELLKCGIKCIPFNKVSPFRGIFMNNRDHRKMTIIDGKVAFSGGVNLSDEYINVTHPHGHWKDNGLKIIGDSIWNLTLIFLTMWNANNDNKEDILKYKYEFKEKEIKNCGYVTAYASGPIHDEIFGEEVYLNIINSSTNYLYIFTPYLIIDTDVINSLVRAAKRGVDVRIVVPGIPDKKLIYSITSSYFDVLTNAGVKVYKYTAGFVHSKVFVSDDKRATVGTLNLDYRSLYLHFENGIYMEDNSEIKVIKKDLENTIESSHLVTKDEVNTGFFKSIYEAILRLFAPLC